MQQSFTNSPPGPSLQEQVHSDTMCCCSDFQVKTKCHQLTSKEKSFGKEFQAMTQKVSLRGNPEASKSQQAFRTEAGAEHSCKKNHRNGQKEVLFPKERFQANGQHP
ncbi:hypothetical protein H1C71_018758 [Ictidomys tridecemlineatus]|nr:hypothetical protein H1C71_018758 [Ictidomys tridecemlineatus]